MQSALRYALTIALSLLFFYSVTMAGQDHPNRREVGVPQRRVHVGGRWKTVRMALGLPSIPSQVNTPEIDPLLRPSAKTDTAIHRLRYDLKVATRFNLRHKREKEESDTQLHTGKTPPVLFFTPEALEQPTITFEKFMAALRKSAAAEKERRATSSAKSKGASAKDSVAKRRRAARWIKRDDC